MIRIDNEVISESAEKKLLCFILDKNLPFKPQVASLYKRGNQKLHALSCIANCMDTKTKTNDEGIHSFPVQLLSSCMDILRERSLIIRWIMSTRRHCKRF